MSEYNPYHNHTNDELIRESVSQDSDLVAELASRLAEFVNDEKDMTFRAAVYGSLRKGFGNHEFMRGANYLGDALVEDFEMYSLGSFPVCVPKDGESVYVEVYEVDMHTLEGLDMLEGYPSFYDRRVVNTVFGEAFMYYMAAKPKGQPRVDGGDWATFFKPSYSFEGGAA